MLPPACNFDEVYNFSNILSKYRNTQSGITQNDCWGNALHENTDSKHGVFPGRFFPVFGPEKAPYLDTFHTVMGKSCRIYLKF